MARGGKRSGSGRKKSVVVVRSREIADKVAVDGVSMLEIMVRNARHFNQVATDAEAILETLTAADITSEALEPAEQFKVLMAEVKKAAGLRMLAQDCASQAARFLHAPINGVDGAANKDDHVPLAERLKAYSRRDAIAGSKGKVVEIPKKKARGR